ncbi:MAG: hypothetical protein HON65_13290, partial [Rhodospirillales bacterium]|nr:hypothetical protein [Rhodospirillales bacterium]
MSFLNKSRISFKLAFVGLTIALLLGLAFSMIQVASDFDDQNDQLDDSIQKILDVARRSATSAAKRLDENLSDQVVDGLLSYDFIIEAKIISDLDDVLAVLSKDMAHSRTRWITKSISTETSSYQVDL